MPDVKFKTSNHIKNFKCLSSVIQKYLSGKLHKTDFNYRLLQEAINISCKENGFFTKDSIYFALSSIADMLEEDNMEKWLCNYKNLYSNESNSRTIGVILAGNIPLVGFHDFLCVLISGNRFLGKMSTKDLYLFPALAKILICIDSRYADYINFTTDKLQGFDAVIATGSDNTARYFEYYFRKYPHIIRKNRKSIAVLRGNESYNELTSLSDDIFLYFGLGCRNVSKVFVPKNYNFTSLIEVCKRFTHYFNHTNYRNNYDYNKTIFQMNNQVFIDGGFYLLQENSLLNSPVSVIHYQYYSDTEELKSYIANNMDNLQCVIGNMVEIDGSIPFGRAQRPQIGEYPDNIDTIEFLLNLKSFTN
jgi:hypothetical protein